MPYHNYSTITELPSLNLHHVCLQACWLGPHQGGGQDGANELHKVRMIRGRDCSLPTSTVSPFRGFDMFVGAPGVKMTVFAASSLSISLVEIVIASSSDSSILVTILAARIAAIESSSTPRIIRIMIDIVGCTTMIWKFDFELSAQFDKNTLNFYSKYFRKF